MDGRTWEITEIWWKIAAYYLVNRNFYSPIFGVGAACHRLFSCLSVKPLAIRIKEGVRL